MVLQLIERLRREARYTVFSGLAVRLEVVPHERAGPPGAVVTRLARESSLLG